MSKTLVLAMALVLGAACSTAMTVDPDAPGYCLPAPKMKKMPKDIYC